MRWNNSGTVDKAIVSDHGVLAGSALIGRAWAALERVIRAESAMTVMMTSLGAGLQGLGAGSTLLDSIGGVQTSADASALPDANILPQDTRAHIQHAEPRYDLPPIVSRQRPAMEWARRETLIGSEFVKSSPQVTLRPKVGSRSPPESPTVQPGPRNESTAVPSLRSGVNSPNGPALVAIANGGGNQPAFPSLEKPTLMASGIGSQVHSPVPTHSGNLNVTKTEIVAKLRAPGGARSN